MLTDGGQLRDENEIEATETVRETLENVDDVNEATRRIHSALSDINDESVKPTVQVVIAEVDNDE